MLVDVVDVKEGISVSDGRSFGREESGMRLSVADGGSSSLDNVEIEVEKDDGSGLIDVGSGLAIGTGLGIVGRIGAGGTCAGSVRSDTSVANSSTRSSFSTKPSNRVECSPTKETLAKSDLAYFIVCKVFWALIHEVIGTGSSHFPSLIEESSLRTSLIKSISSRER